MGKKGNELSEKTMVLRPSECELTVWNNVITRQIEDLTRNKSQLGIIKLRDLQ